jgi:hypothetical protein
VLTQYTRRGNALGTILVLSVEEHIGFVKTNVMLCLIVEDTTPENNGVN